LALFIANEPEEKKKKNFQIWKQLRENSPFEYVDISESEKILNMQRNTTFYH